MVFLCSVSPRQGAPSTADRVEMDIPRFSFLFPFSVFSGCGNNLTVVREATPEIPSGIPSGIPSAQPMLQGGWQCCTSQISSCSPCQYSQLSQFAFLIAAVVHCDPAQRAGKMASLDKTLN